ncbi:MAG: FMN-binding glutamate synthase family protein [Dehalococcoidales bacterium]
MKSQTYDADTIKDIREKAKLGRYLIRGCGTSRKVPSWDELVFLPAQLSRLAIDSYREPVDSRTVLGTRFAHQPLEMAAPVMIAGMSYGALSKETKLALARASTRLGIADNTGEGGMIPEQREVASKLIYQCLPARYGFSLSNLLKADAVELMIGQGAKPGMGGHLMAEKVTAEIAAMRTIPIGIDLRSPTRHPDIFGGDDLRFKVEELREATNYRVPIGIKVAAGRVRDDVKLAAKAGADIIAIDGIQGGTGAAPEVLIEHMGIPSMAAVVAAVDALEELDLVGVIHLVIMGGIRNGADAAKALALGADAVAIGSAALIAMGCTVCQKCHTGTCPQGINTQDPELRAKLNVEEAAEKVTNFIRSVITEIEMISRVCGKVNVHNLEREDLRALTMEASAITGIPLVGH